MLGLPALMPVHGAARLALSYGALLSYGAPPVTPPVPLATVLSEHIACFCHLLVERWEATAGDCIRLGLAASCRVAGLALGLAQPRRASARHRTGRLGIVHAQPRRASARHPVQCAHSYYCRLRLSIQLRLGLTIWPGLMFKLMLRHTLVLGLRLVLMIGVRLRRGVGT